ncbi:polycystin-2 isoform X1 [Lingula anatina]|uniref:Polycystin-2 isoform X1 n=1 Tax=Lingula anatina TaxID=7574 RepID=A0A1S3K9X5_LINAN|nr:polycystin-2 isoform X1 [Lingula anatina]|eukprot:XP_013419430.1 polycystin-2 isoform X1 [Lingula anatina]
MSAKSKRSPRGSNSNLTEADEAEMDRIVGRPDSARSRKSAWDEDGGMDNMGFDRPSSARSYREEEEVGRIETTDDLFPTDTSMDEKKKAEEAAPPSGCCGKFLGGIRSMWATRQLQFEESTKNQELYIKTTLRELIVYILFLVILMVLTFGMTSSNMYYYTKVMSELFLDNSFNSNGQTFRSISNLGDYWQFARGPLMDGLYWETWYNNRNVSQDELGFIFYENKLLGVPRIRQLKVKNGSCKVESNFGHVIDDCYGPYASGDEDKSTFGKANGTAWSYQTSEQLDGSGHYGILTRYEGGGYVQKLSTTKAKSLAIVDDLKQNLWLTRGTRAVFTDFTVYNANINLFCVIRLLVEYPATGGALSSWSFRTIKLIRYVSVGDYFVMACECIFILFIIYYIIEEVLEIKKHKVEYFKHFWNVVDILVLVISSVCIAFSIYRTIAVDTMLEKLLENPEEFPDFEFLSFWQMQFNSAVAVAVFFAWVKVFKYISFNKTMTQLSSTLSRCAGDLAGFLVMFCIMFFAFAQLGVLVFGAVIRDFSNFWNAVFTLFRIILGDFDFNSLQDFDKFLGPLYFFCYVFFVFLILLNMFLAIINDTYADVKSDIALQKNDFEMTDYFKKGYQKMMDKLNFKRDKIVDIQKALASADMDNDMVVDFDEWRTELKKRGYADTEIEALFAKYDVDGDRTLDESEQKQMAVELEGQKAKLDEEENEIEKDKEMAQAGRKMGVTVEEFSVLQRRVDRMEHSIGSIVSKIDAVLVKLEAMEKAKLKRRETMAKILDSITEADGLDDEEKRDQMERLVRDELDKWDQDIETNSTGASSGSDRSRTASSRPPSSGYVGDRVYQNRKDSSPV